jgi:hypothetical protein
MKLLPPSSWSKSKLNKQVESQISFIHEWLSSPLLGPGLFFSFIIFFTQTLVLLGRASARRKASTYTQNNTNTHRHPCLDWDKSRHVLVSCLLDEKISEVLPVLN